MGTPQTPPSPRIPTGPRRTPQNAHPLPPGDSPPAVRQERKVGQAGGRRRQRIEQPSSQRFGAHPHRNADECPRSRAGPESELPSIAVQASDEDGHARRGTAPLLAGNLVRASRAAGHAQALASTVQATVDEQRQAHLGFVHGISRTKPPCWRHQNGSVPARCNVRRLPRRALLSSSAHTAPTARRRSARADREGAG